MRLAAGTRVGPYEIRAPLGAGGMGEVYRARDTRLGRTVAIKVLLEGTDADLGQRRRFEQEARAASALNHPHICVLYDIGSDQGLDYIVMEYLEGESLAERLRKGPMPAAQVLEYGLQIASALDKAHREGIVHRDLKPGNVMITKAGAKLLDFGLAKLRVAGTVAPEGASVTPTQGTSLTVKGAIFGTLAYMSPEQLEGRDADRRSDLFSFGAMLYEMLSGKRPFQKTTAPETMAAILREDPPDLRETGRSIPPGLERIVRHCLEKEPADRFQSARDLTFDLQGLSGSAVASGPSVSIARKELRPWLTPIAVAAVLGLATVASYRMGKKAERRSVEGINFRQMTFRPQAIFQAAFAPDGETIIYSAALQGNVPELFTIRPEYPEPRPLGLPRTHLLSISSKGELAVLTNARFDGLRLFTGTLARVSLAGTAPREILENVRQADWSPDGSELAITRMAEGKYRLEFPIGKVLYETAGYLSDLRVSPRGDRIALFEHPREGDDRGSVILVDLAGKRTPLSGDFEREEGLSWSQTGDEVLFTASKAGSVMTLYGVDLSGHRRIALKSAGGLTIHDVSRNGRWLVTRDDWRAGISVLTPGASAERDLSWLVLSVSPFLSRDGRMLLFADMSPAAGPNYRLCLRTTDGGPVVLLGEGTPWGFSPDGKWVLATIDTPPQLLIYPTGPGETRRLPRGDLESYQWVSWFPDGKSVLVCGNETGKAARCYAQDVSGGLPRPVTSEGTTNGLVSPNGTQILYRTQARSYFAQRVGSGTAQAVIGLTADDQIIGWSTDSGALYVFSDVNMPFRIERLDFASGRRVLIREVAPIDRAGVIDGGSPSLTEDTKSYAYGYDRMTSQLFVVEGAR